MGVFCSCSQQLVTGAAPITYHKVGCNLSSWRSHVPVFGRGYSGWPWAGLASRLKYQAWKGLDWKLFLCRSLLQLLAADWAAIAPEPSGLQSASALEELCLTDRPPDSDSVARVLRALCAMPQLSGKSGLVWRLWNGCFCWMVAWNVNRGELG